MLVSIIISAFNEEKYLPGLIEDIEKQTYPHNLIEIIFINAMSTDDTKDIMERFREKKTDFFRVYVVDNPKKIQPSGFNLGYRTSTGDVVVKVDAHSKITPSFIQESVETIKRGENICGGKRPTIVETTDDFSKTLNLVEENMFGSSIADYRKSDTERYVNSIFHGMYRREVFKKTGLLNEKLIRTEDNEIHYRIRKNGFKIKYNPSILSYQYIRPTFKKMMKQKYGNGFWIGLTAHVEIKCLSIFHFVPLVFVLGIIFSLLMLPLTKIFAILIGISYALFTVLVTIMTIINNKFNATLLLIPFLLFSVHFSYGWGTLIGLIKGFGWKKEYYSANE